jgi:predicted house-cleaning noncanonical NTP pyrophosphatase (MazG superfamily)
VPTYNKLVRDRIPEVIENSGKSFRTRILDDEEYLLELIHKSQEELQEYLSCETDEEAVDELADLLEIIHALVNVHGASAEQLEAVRKKKASERGGFQEKIYLIDVEED